MLVYAFEGPDGAGKSTLMGLVEKKLVGLGKRVVTYRQPGGSVAGEKIRELLLNPDIPMLPVTQTYLFAASRSETLSEIEFQLNVDPDTIVLIDRWNMSTYAYQLAANSLRESDSNVKLQNERAIEHICKLSSGTNDIKVKFYFITASFETLLERRPLDESVDRFEMGGLTMRERIFVNYDRAYSKPFQSNIIGKYENNTIEDQAKNVDRIVDDILSDKL